MLPLSSLLNIIYNHLSVCTGIKLFPIKAEIKTQPCKVYDTNSRSLELITQRYWILVDRK